MTLRTIVVGVDLSPGSQAALRWAAELAEATGASVVATHCFEPLAHVEELEPGVDLRAIREKVARSVEEEMCRPLVERGVRHSSVMREGDPAGVLVDVADEVGADLVVVGSRRLGALKGLALGSTSSKLTHLAQRPLAIVPTPTPDAR